MKECIVAQFFWLTVYFHFAIWSNVSVWDGGLYNPAKFHRHVSIQAEVISIHLKSNMASAAISDL